VVGAGDGEDGAEAAQAQLRAARGFILRHACLSIGASPMPFFCVVEHEKSRKQIPSSVSGLKTMQESWAICQESHHPHELNSLAANANAPCGAGVEDAPSSLIR
jgi:hypothetical protein